MSDLAARAKEAQAWAASDLSRAARAVEAGQFDAATWGAAFGLFRLREARVLFQVAGVPEPETHEGGMELFRSVKR